MAVHQMAGYWVGTFLGTNQGGMTVDLTQDGEKLSGKASFSEPSLGQYQYSVKGSLTEKGCSLHMTPLHGATFQLGNIQVVGNLSDENQISGRWTSTIGTEGSFEMKRNAPVIETSELPKMNSVFIVHGRDEGSMHAVARFITQLRIEPVILHEQINMGMTVIEKFEDFAARAGFAVILMTPDDVGNLVGNDAERKPRARQNVVLELGYFAAKIGRQKTFVLIKGDIEMPSDFFGVVYARMDSGDGWKLSLGKELKRAGFSVDLNALL